MNAALPLLRQDLGLAASSSRYGSGEPTWTLHDPGSNRFFEIGWPAFEILSRWWMGQSDRLVAAINSETTLTVTDEDIESVAGFLINHHLAVASSPQDTERLRAAAGRARLSPFRWLLHNYLFLRLPLLRPMPFLAAVYPYFAWIYTRGFWLAIASIAVIGLYLASRQWDAFIHTFNAYRSFEGVLAFGVALSLGKVLHEFGHALTAYRYGCRVPQMGIAFLVMWPVLYTDTSEAWKLSSRRQRMAIGVAGIAAELALAAIATLVWSFLPDGPMRGGVFLLATSTWVLTIAINASPFTRFDGYFLLSDWLNLPNLHERIFALARWWLREKLFGLGDPAPEEIPAGRRRGLILLAFVTAAYRLVLFLSIALLVGHVFFKALGIVLMAVEIGFFVVLPILREVSVWWHRRADIRFNLPTLRTFFALAIILGIFLIPWRATISLPAVLQNAEAQGVYALHSGRIEMLGATNGAVVSAGDMLVELSSPELSQDRDTARVTAETLAQQVRQQPFDSVQQAEGAALQRSWEAAQRHLAGAEAALGELKLKAMFSGRVVEMPNGLAEGSWVKRGELLMRVLGDGGINGEAFLSEADLARVNSGVQARFIPDMLETPEIPCRIAGIDPINLATLSQPVLASLYGGSIPARPNANGTLEPLHAIYRVRLVDCALDGVLATELSGRAVVAGSADPIGLAFWRGLVSWLRRELSV